MNSLTQEEQQLLHSVENEAWQSRADLPQRKKNLQRIAEQQLNAKTHFDIALPHHDIEILKAVAAKEGISYSVVAENILHQYIEKNLPFLL